MTRIARVWLVAWMGLAVGGGFSKPGGASESWTPDAVAHRADDAHGAAAAVAPGIGPSARPGRGLPLEAFLDADGRLSLPEGFSGSLDPGGLALVSKPGESPRFAAKNAIDDAARWDPQFGQAVGCNGLVRSTAVLADGRVLLGGGFTICGNVAVNRVAIWNPATGVFQPLGSGATNGVNGEVNAIAVAGSDVYVGGRFTEAGGAAANHVARFDLTTETWITLGSGTADGVGGCSADCVYTLALVGSDVYVGGSFTQAGGAPANRVARFNTTTQSWAPLGSMSNGVSGCLVAECVRAIAISGRYIYVGGGFTQAGGVTATFVARFDTLEQSWAPLLSGAANGVGSTVFALAVAGSGVYVGGNFEQAGPVAANRVARFDTTNQTWSVLGSVAANGVNNDVHAIAISGSNVYVGGIFTEAVGEPVNFVASYNTVMQTWSSLGADMSIGVGGGSFPSVAALAIAASDVYVGGSFTQSGGAAANRVARFNTTTMSWSSLGTGAANGVNNRVFAIAVAGSDVYVGGSFTQAGGVAANRVARFNTTTQSWFPLGSGSENGVGGCFGDECVRALAIAGSDIYVGGGFTQAGSTLATFVARFNTMTQSWSPLGSGTNSTVFALAVAGANVFVGGNFTEAGGVVANRVAGFNTANHSWFSLGDGAANGVNNVVAALAIAGNHVYVGGFFAQAGPWVANRVARFNTMDQTWAPLGSGAANGVNGAYVVALTVAGSGIYVGGSFTQAGPEPANSVARFDTTMLSWSSLGTGLANGVNSDVYTLATAGSDVFVGGIFTQAGGAPRNRVARFNTTTESWGSLGTPAVNGVNGEGYALGIACTNDAGTPVLCEPSARLRDVYFGGSFSSAGPNVSLNIARYDIRRSTTSSIAASAASSVVANTPITFTASVAATNFPAQAGNVAFLDNARVIAPCESQPLVGGADTRTATCNTAALRVGSHSISGRYLGDVLNFIGTSEPVTIEVLPPAFAYSPATLPGAVFGSAGYSSGTIAVSLAAGTGVISPVLFQVVDAGQLPPGLNAAPQANGLLITGTPTQAGTFNFTVRATDSSSTAVGGPFSSDRQYTIAVARASQTIASITRVDAVPLDNGVAFADGDFAVQASASSGLPVSIDSTTPMVCQVIAPAFTVQPLQIGTCTLRARQGGNGNFESAPDVLRTFQVKATPAVDVASSPNPTVWPVGGAQDAAVLTATVEAPGGATPTGSVRFQRAGNTIAGCAAQPLSGSGSVATASCTTTALARGANAITAAYAGDALNVAVSSNVHSHQLNVGTATGIAMITPSPCVVGESCMVGVAVAAGNGTPPGSVQVASSTGGSCTITLAASGGSCALTATTPGSGTVSATYLGSPPWLASPAATQVHPFVAVAGDIFGNGFEPAVAVPRSD